MNPKLKLEVRAHLGWVDLIMLLFIPSPPGEVLQIGQNNIEASFLGIF
jgi:hypothetical protein